MTKAERLLQRVATGATIVDGVPTISLECGHQIKMPDMSLSALSVIRNKITAGRKLVDLCPMCKEIPHPTCNPDPFWKGKLKPMAHSTDDDEASDYGQHETRNSVQA